MNTALATQKITILYTVISRYERVSYKNTIALS